MSAPYWDYVGRIVEKKNRELKRYSFFEETWEALDGGADLVILKAPTGCGKTEATTVPFMAKLAEGRPPWASLIYVLPTRSLAFFMRARLDDSLTALGIQGATVTLDHGELLSVKPYLEGDIAITTYDTLLYTTYGFRSPGYHLLLPVGKVALSLIVMDEVQLLQDTTWFTMEVLPWHVRCLLDLGAQVVMMTATMPPPLEGMLAERCAVKKVETIEASDRPGRGRIEVVPKLRPLPTDKEELKEILGGVLSDSGLPLLIVVNKVDKAVEIYEKTRDLAREGLFPDGVDVLLLHSRLRRGLRNRVEAILAEKGRRGEPLVLISTQVVEAGLDYNFKTLITELCPVDSLIQRVGRIARKPDTDGKALVFLDAGAGGGVYPGPLITRSFDVVKEHDDLVAEATCNIHAASELLAEVYTRDLVDELTAKAGVRYLIKKVRGFIETFVDSLASPRPETRVREYLLRLGVEVKCWVPSEEQAEKLLAGEEILVSPEEFRNDVVSISVIKVPGKPLKLPSAVIHELGGKRVMVAIDVVRKEERLALRGKTIDAEIGELLGLVVGEGPLLLLNLTYYEVRDGVEVGVVKPW